MQSLTNWMHLFLEKVFSSALHCFITNILANPSSIRTTFFQCYVIISKIQTNIAKLYLIYFQITNIEWNIKILIGVLITMIFIIWNVEQDDLRQEHFQVFCFCLKSSFYSWDFVSSGVFPWKISDFLDRRMTLW